MFRYCIIDDEPLIRQGTIARLEGLAEEIQCVGEAEDAQEGLALIEAERPDLVITDMHMPTMDGAALLREMVKSWPEVAVIVISGYQDFEYLQQAVRAKAVDYLLKPFSQQELVDAVQRAMHSLTEQKESLVAAQAARASLEKQEKVRDQEALTRAVLGEISPREGTFSRQLWEENEDRDLLLSAVYADGPIPAEVLAGCLEENHGRSQVHLLLHPREERLAWLLIRLPGTGLKNPLAYGRDVLRSADTVFFDHQRRAVYGWSQVHTGLTELPAMGREAAEALNRLPVHPEGREERFFQVPENQEGSALPLWPGKDKWIFSVEAGKVSEAGELVRKLFAFYRGQKGLRIGDVKRHLAVLEEQLRYFLSLTIPEIHAQRSRERSGAADCLFSLEELEPFFWQYSTNLAENMAQQKIYGSGDLVQNVKTFAEHYYQKEISVELAADWFHVNRSYLSHTFRQRAGMSFTQYLNQVRIAHGRELLIKTDKKIYQVASLCGYNNAKYFIRIFRKMEGMTPEEYRRAGKGENP